MTVVRQEEEREAIATSLNSYTEIDPHADLTLWQAVRKWWRVVAYCIGLASGVLMYGYDTVIISTASAMPSFQKDFGQQLHGTWILPSLWLGLWTVSSPGASVLGALVGGTLQDCYGRRLSLAIGSCLCAVGVAISFLSYLPRDIEARRGVFLAGRGFQGGALGLVLTTTQTYMSEVLPPSLRGPILAFFPIFTLLGQLVGAAVIYGCLQMKSGYTICIATQWPFSILPLLVSVFMPESPTYLVRKNRLAEAHRSQKRLDPRGVESDDAIGTIQRNIDRERKQADATYIDCFNRANRRRTCVVMIASVLPLFFGLSIMAKASYFTQIVGMEPGRSVLILIVAIVCGLLANICSMWVSSRVGRRPLILSGFALLALMWGSMGIAGLWPGVTDVWYAVKPDRLVPLAVLMVLRYTGVALILITIIACLTVWPAVYAVSSEASSLHLRARAQGISGFALGAAASIFGFVMPYVYNPDKGNLRGKVGFVYAGLGILAFVVSYLCIPEMKGRTPSEIDRMFDENISAKDFRHWSRSGSRQNNVSRLDDRIWVGT